MDRRNCLGYAINELYVGTAMTGRRGALIHALGAIDMALWDLAGKARGVPTWQLLGEARPDLTLVFDMPASAGLARAAGRKDVENRFERKGEKFHAKLREAFLDIARREANRCVVIDASRAMDQVHAEVLQAVHSRLGI